MSLASWFYKAFTPKKELLDAAKDLIKMIENDREAAKLMAKLDGIKLEMDNANLVRTEWRRILTTVISDWNNHCGSDDYKLKLRKVDHGISVQDGTRLSQYSLRGKGINLAYRIIVSEEEGYANDIAEETAYRMLLLSLTKAGINALNPEIYVAPGVHQAHTYTRSEIDLRK